MAPANPRQVFVWSLPLAFLLTLLWYRRKRRASLRSDPGGTPKHLVSKAVELKPECGDTDLVALSAMQIPNSEVQSEKLCAKTASFTPLENANTLADKVDDVEVEVKESATSDIVDVAEEACPDTCSPADTGCNTSLQDTTSVCSKKVETLTQTAPVEEQIENSDDKAVLSDDKGSSEFGVHTNITFMETAVEEKAAGDTMARKASSETCTQEKGSSIKEDDVPKKIAKEKMSVVEDKLSALGLGEDATSAVVENHGAERDSANHSPADVMLASPSISSCSDAHSEGSSDSGKGCSDVATPPSRTPASGSSLAGDSTLPSIYEFVMPQQLVGRLIGRHGAFVHHIKEKTNACIIVKRHPDTNALKICAIEGTQADIEGALNMIRQKFPLKQYPEVTLEQVCFVPPVPVFAVLPDYMQLQLIEDVNNDVILSSLVTPGHFFLQQPTHPTYPALNSLNACMNICYNDAMAPQLPAPPEPGIICAAPTVGGWYRAQTVSIDADTETCTVKFVDYGGYLSIDYTFLRQIRSDFMTLPFQAAECYLANICPVGGVEAEWSKEAVASMEELTRGQVLQAQVGGYAENSVPIVYLYAMHNSEVILVNEELVNRGVAESLEPADTGPS